MGFQFFRRKLGILKYEPEKLIKNKMIMSKVNMKQVAYRVSKIIISYQFYNKLWNTKAGIVPSIVEQSNQVMCFNITKIS